MFLYFYTASEEWNENPKSPTQVEGKRMEVDIQCRGSAPDSNGHHRFFFC